MKPTRKVVCAAIKQGNYIVTGARHFDSIMIMQIKLASMEKYIRTCEQGFIDQFGVFMDRKEALEVALEAGQVINFERNGSKDILYSEGLY